MITEIIRYMRDNGVILHSVYLSHDHGQSDDVTHCDECTCHLETREVSAPYEPGERVTECMWSLLAFDFRDPANPGLNSDLSDLDVRHLCSDCHDAWHDELTLLNLLDGRGETSYLLAQAISALSSIPATDEVRDASHVICRASQTRHGLERAREAVTAIPPTNTTASRRGRVLRLIDEAWEAVPARRGNALDWVAELKVGLGQ
jgi:hypothetical protein